ncbi:hypothetical protein GCM10011380_19450 [Sphingomonas metalli]|uniref:Inositolphosphotransferase Aur1/Ipt1 domain-containing protein n=1 Tax=Sphingomonas metalli TaxID=1779358 RepID=A0A916T3B9_9SPHN|nr:phosphatase PAP2 family protein [Sphingomonas metalli]GGB30113.1 hypothetical protein GCM10011380_19450 [Sphingomonas metalli]
MVCSTQTAERFAPAWALIATLTLCTLLACARLGFRFVHPALPAGAVLLLAGAAIVGAVTDRPRLRAGAGALLLMTLFTLIGVVLSYALAARGGALWDGALARLDRQLWFDWPAVFAAADRSGALLWIGGIAYHSLPVQMVVCIVVLSATSRNAALQTTVTAAIACGMATILISGAIPAMGNVFDPDRYSALWPSVAWLERDLIAGLRDGSQRSIDLTQLWGIVTFPSYHAALPLILAWGLRDVPWLRVIAPVWAALTILATPVFGGHYGVDVLAGIAMAPAALFIVSSETWLGMFAMRGPTRNLPARPLPAPVAGGAGRVAASEAIHGWD